MSQPPNSQPTSNSVQAALKAQSIKILRGTINRLEELVTKLEAPSEPTTPSWNKWQSKWSRFLAQIRNLLPALARVSDTRLTSIIAAIAIASIVTTTAILSKSALQANVPIAVQTQPEPDEVTPIVSPTPEIIAPAEEIPPLESLPESPPVEEPVTSEATPTDNTEAIAHSTTPKAIAPAEEPPAAALELTPEQTLIAAIEKQVAQISNREGDGIVQSIQANFPASSLTVIVTSDWYNLNLPEQDKLAAQMLQRAKDLDFIHLEVVDSQKHLIARSPVVGENMVIVKRQA